MTKRYEKALPVKTVVPDAKMFNLGQTFPLQCLFTEDPARYIVAQCSRRAGKSNGLAIRFFKTLHKYPKSQCIYLSLTRESALAIMWPVLKDLNDKHNLGCTFVDSKMIMTYPNGAILRCIGADMKNFVRRLKGIKSPGIAVDEAQDFGDHLQHLVDDVLTPMLTDYKDSWLAITGTPGPVPTGYFFEITQEKRYGYSQHRWTLLDNPFLPEPSKFIDEMKTLRQWDETNPTLLREWRNQWVLDKEALWIRYDENVNHYTQLPNLELKDWNYIMGIDLGFRDADAIAILAWSEKDPNTYLIEEVITKKQGLTELVTQIQEMQIKYSCSKMVIDEGGLGKKLAEEMRRQHGIPVQPADKARKQENVEFLNDSLRTGKFKAKGKSTFAQDSYKVQIDWEKSTPNRIVIKKVPHSDIIDAVLYAFHESPAYSYQKVPVMPKYGTTEWAKKQTEDMFQQAVDHFSEQADIIKRLNGDWD